jgi:hypothetical protein
MYLLFVTRCPKLIFSEAVDPDRFEQLPNVLGPPLAAEINCSLRQDIIPDV